MSYFVTILLYAIASINLAAAVTYTTENKRFLEIVIGLIVLSAAIWCSLNVWGM